MYKSLLMNNNLEMTHIIHVLDHRGSGKHLRRRIRQGGSSGERSVLRTDEVLQVRTKRRTL